MVHFYNGDKAEAYLNLVDSEILPEADVEIIDSPSAPTNRNPPSDNSLCTSKPQVVQLIKVTIACALLATVVVLSYSVHIQKRNLNLLKEHLNIATGDLNATSLCDRSNTYYSNIRDERHMRRRENGLYCIDVCSHMRQVSPLINGLTVLTDPTKDGCWCKTNISLSTRYQSCFIAPDTETTPTPKPEDSKYLCEWRSGAGSGGTEVKVGVLQGDVCVKACLHMKQFDNLINGVTVYSDPTKLGCWCEQRMRTVRKSSRHKTCFLTPRYNRTEQVDPGVCDFSTGYGSGGTLMAMGKRSARDCVEDCLHMKKIERRVNGVTIKSKDGSCWCDVGKTTVSYALNTCHLEESDGKCVLRDTAYRGTDLKKIPDLETWKSCSEVCRGINSCVSWTWFSSNKTCNVKSGGGEQMTMKDAVSGTRECGTDMCSFRLGNGRGGSSRRIGSQTGAACVSACLHMRKVKPGINGVTVYQDKLKSSCYCRSNMTHIGGIYKTCFFKPNVTLTPLTTFHDYVPDCPLQPGDGTGVGEIYLGKLDREACTLGCLHVKKIDDTIQGVNSSFSRMHTNVAQETSILAVIISFRNPVRSSTYFSSISTKHFHL